MDSRNKTNLILAVIVAVLGTLTWLDFRADQPDPPAPLTNLVANAIQRVEIRGPLEDKILLEREGANWFMREPIAIAGNPESIARAIEVATEQCSNSYSAINTELLPLGLDPALLSITLNDQQIDFGDIEPLSNRRYVRVHDRVWLCADRNYYFISNSAAGFASKRLLASGADISAITMKGIAIQKYADGWTGLPEGWNEARADEWRALWRTANAESVRPLTLNIFGKPGVTLLFEGEQNPLHLIPVENAGDNKFVLAREDLKLEYIFSAELGQRLLGQSGQP